jgi:hypothetical protein
MSCIAVVNRVPGLDDGDAAFWAEAWNQQAREVADVHGVQYTPVVFYGTAEGLPIDCRILQVLPQIDVPGASGFHDDDLGVVFAEIKVTAETSVTGSHEVAEEMADPTVNLWDPFDDDHEQAHELCDRVEGDFYVQQATVLGKTRSVQVSNYLLPSAFDPGGKAPFDRMGRLTSWNGMTAGGYVIVRDIGTGKVSDVFKDDGVGSGHVAARRAPRVIPGPAAAAAITEKLGRSGSRLARRLRG